MSDFTTKIILRTATKKKSMLILPMVTSANAQWLMFSMVHNIEKLQRKGDID